MPNGFRYQTELISEAEEKALASTLSNLSLKPFEFHGIWETDASFPSDFDTTTHAVGLRKPSRRLGFSKTMMWLRLEIPTDFGAKLACAVLLQGNRAANRGNPRRAPIAAPLAAPRP
jgi:hypothetical protein